MLVPDLYTQGTADRAADRRYAAKATRSAFPSGRDTYRTLADYNAELKQLAAENPNLVRLITLPNKTWLGKDVLGVEITENVNRNDGKPAFANLGVHHAREWPSGEHAMEWAIELVKGFKSGDPRATNIVRNSRNLVVPVVNADGFEASRNAVGAPAGDATRASTTPSTSRAARQRRRVPAQELPAARRLRGRQLRHLGRAGRAGRGPQPQLRRRSGAAPARTRTRSPRPTAAPARSPSPSRATSRPSCPATR